MLKIFCSIIYLAISLFLGVYLLENKRNDDGNRKNGSDFIKNVIIFIVLIILGIIYKRLMDSI